MVAAVMWSGYAYPLEETEGSQQQQQQIPAQIGNVESQKVKETQPIGVEEQSNPQQQGKEPQVIQVPDINPSVPPSEPGPNTDLDTANTFWGGYGGYGGWGGSYYRPYYGRYYGGGWGGGWGGRRWGGGWGGGWGGRWGGGWGRPSVYYY